MRIENFDGNPILVAIQSLRPMENQVDSFGEALKEARKNMGWDQRSLGAALRMSDKTIGQLELKGQPDRPAAQAVLIFMEAYGIEFEEDFLSFRKFPQLRQRYFLTLDFRFDADPEKQVQVITRRMRVVGMSVVRRLNKARNTLSNFDGVELHVPEVNLTSFESVLTDFLEEFGSPIDCLVRNEIGIRLNSKEEIKELWEY